MRFMLLSRLAHLPRFGAILIVAGASISGPTKRAPAAELVSLTPETWSEYEPKGKEVDCIYGDLVMRNDQLVAVIAQPIAGRRANMTVPNVGGCVIDLSRVDAPSDLLSAFYPGGAGMEWRALAIESAATTAIESESPHRVRLRGKSVSLSVMSAATADRPAATTRYTLADGQPYLLVETTFTPNPGKPLVEASLVDELRIDGMSPAPDGETDLYFSHDIWFGQAYGVQPTEGNLKSTSDGRNARLEYFPERDPTKAPAPDDARTLVRRLIPGRDLLAVRGLAGELAQVAMSPTIFQVQDAKGRPVAEAMVNITRGEVLFGAGRADPAGRLECLLPAERFAAAVSATGYGSKTLTVSPGETTVQLDEPGWLALQVGDEQGGKIPCKVQIRGRDGIADPYLGNDSGERGVRNLIYTETGHAKQALTPGRYEIIVSHGPEFDAVFAEVMIRAGEVTPLVARLVRSVQTEGWISADFHSHSSPSGDNTSSQLGRVLNLLCEHVEFAPCTEHNRNSTYAPHLAALKAERLLGTCVGIELTGSPLPVNHHNAFPLILEPRTQDGGGPGPDASPETQIERLALWDGASDKLVQQNHPDIGHVFFDRDGDGQPDAGLRKSVETMDVVEVHPPEFILQGALIESQGKQYNNTIFNWLQLLNRGYWIPGVVNTDAHYNFHGSGFLRVYLASPTDEPAEVKPLDVVHAAEKGQMFMTSGPFLEVRARHANTGPVHGYGETLVSSPRETYLAIRVQCPNWFDIDRVQILLNGKLTPELNFTRQSHPRYYSGGVVKFEREFRLELLEDTHLIVVAAGEGSTLGRVMGPSAGQNMPIAVSNPIFVDVDGDGFKANGDTLGAPLPVKRP